MYQMKDSIFRLLSMSYWINKVLIQSSVPPLVRHVVNGMTAHKSHPHVAGGTVNSWPYSTAHVLRSVAKHIREYSHQNPKITVTDYVDLLKKYALTQYKNGKPYVAECHSPIHNYWVGDSW